MADVLDDRIRAAAKEIADAATALADQGPQPHVLLRVKALYQLVDRLKDAAAFWEIEAGAGLGAAAEDLALTEATVRRRYGRGVPDLPLLAVLYEPDASVDL